MVLVKLTINIVVQETETESRLATDILHCISLKQNVISLNVIPSQALGHSPVISRQGFVSHGAETSMPLEEVTFHCEQGQYRTSTRYASVIRE